MDHAVGIGLEGEGGEVGAFGRAGDQVLLLEDDVGQGPVEPPQLLVHPIILSQARIKLALLSQKMILV